MRELCIECFWKKYTGKMKGCMPDTNKKGRCPECKKSDVNLWYRKSKENLCSDGY